MALMPWSTDEKLMLHDALKTHGVGNIRAISDELPFKSVTEIRNAIKRYERKAIQSYQKECSSKSEAPMDEWIQVLKQASSQENGVNPISRVLKYIALFEEHDESDVDLSACYHVLSDLTRGVLSKELTDDTLLFFNDSLVKMADEISKEDTRVEEEFLKNVQVEEQHLIKKPKTYSRKDKTTLADVESLNVLNIPEKLLKPK